MTASVSLRPARRFVPAAFASLVAVSAAMTLALPAFAITDEEVFRAFRFNTTPPGARAMGRGGAFIGLADDATALAINPAGIGFMDRPQVVADVMGTSLDDIVYTAVPGAFPAGTNALGTSVAEAGAPEIFASGTIVLEEESMPTPSFFGYVQPINEYFVMGFSRHERYHVERDSVSGFFAAAPAGIVPLGAVGTIQPLGTRGSIDMLMDTYTVTLAWLPYEELSLAINLSIARLDVLMENENLGYVVPGPGAVGAGTLIPAVDYRTFIDDDDIQFTFTAGLLYQPHRKVSIGAVYRDGPEFDVIESVEGAGLRAGALIANLTGRGIANAGGSFTNHFNTPDQWGVGLAFGPFFEPRGGGGLTITADAVVTEYTDLLDQFVTGLNNQSFGALSTGVAYGIEDEAAFHVGLDWAWTVGYNNTMHVSIGAYSDPDNAIVSGGRVAPATVVDPTLPAGTPVSVGQWFPRTDNSEEIHGTIGLGFGIKRGFTVFALDVAADISDLGELYWGTARFEF